MASSQTVTELEYKLQWCNVAPPLQIKLLSLAYLKFSFSLSLLNTLTLSLSLSFMKQSCTQEALRKKALVLQLTVLCSYIYVTLYYDYRIFNYILNGCINFLKCNLLNVFIPIFFCWINQKFQLITFIMII